MPRTASLAPLCLLLLVLSSCSDGLSPTGGAGGPPTPAHSATPTLAIAASEMASPIGPLQVIPGGYVRDSVGDAGDASGMTLTYSAMDPARVRTLTWGLVESVFGAFNNAHVWYYPVAEESAPSLGVARMLATVPFLTATDEYLSVRTRLTISVTDLSGTPLPVDVGTEPTSGATHTVSETAFRVHFAFEARLLDTDPWLPMQSLAQMLHAEHGGPTGGPSFQLQAGFWVTIVCPAGKYRSGIDCLITPAGTYTREGATAPVPCAAGTFQPLSGMSECLLAETGRHVSLPGATEQQDCSPGTYSNVEGAAECMLAPAGHYVQVPGARQALPCLPGTYQPVEGSTRCEPTAAGHYQNLGGSGSQLQCPAGSFQDEVQSVACKPAPAGYFTSAAGATTAAPCSAGMFQPLAGRSACDPSPAGHYVNMTGATAAVPCPAGRFQPSMGRRDCDPTQPGYYQDAQAATSQLPCAIGTYQPGHGRTACDLAEVGHYVAVSASASQQPCALGSYQPLAGQASCSLTDAGYFQDTHAATAQLPCPLGRYQPDRGAAACMPAAPGYYVGVMAATAQTPCPAETTTLVHGATECLQMERQVISFSGTPSWVYERQLFQVVVKGGGSGNPITIAASSPCMAAAGGYVGTIEGTCKLVAGQAGGGLYLRAVPAVHLIEIRKAPAVIAVDWAKDSVTTLVTDGSLSKGDGTALTVTLENAKRQYARENDVAADAQMGAFVNKVTALERARRIPAAPAQALRDLAARVVEAPLLR